MLKMGDEKRFRLIATLILLVISIVAIFPMVLLIVASFTDENELITRGYQLFPKLIVIWKSRLTRSYAHIL